MKLRGLDRQIKDSRRQEASSRHVRFVGSSIHMAPQLSLLTQLPKAEPEEAEARGVVGVGGFRSEAEEGGPGGQSPLAGGGPGGGEATPWCFCNSWTQMAAVFEF